MDIKEQITKAVEKITKDEALKKQFASDPIGAVEKAVGVDIPDDIKDKVVTGVKAKIGADKVAGIAEGLKKLI